MGDFFHGWRRKAGCVTLVMALVLLGAWIRSLQVLDQVRVSREYQTPIYCLQSANGSIRWIVDEARGAEIYLWMSRTRGNAPHLFADGTPECEWKFRWLGFGAGKPSRLETIWFIPYWSIVIPLTLLSACLILWKPRQAPKAVASVNVNSN